METTLDVVLIFRELVGNFISQFILKRITFDIIVNLLSPFSDSTIFQISIKHDKCLRSNYKPKQRKTAGRYAESTERSKSTF